MAQGNGGQDGGVYGRSIAGWTRPTPQRFRDPQLARHFLVVGPHSKTVLRSGRATEGPRRAEDIQGSYWLLPGEYNRGGAGAGRDHSAQGVVGRERVRRGDEEGSTGGAHACGVLGGVRKAPQVSRRSGRSLAAVRSGCMPSCTASTSLRSG